LHLKLWLRSRAFRPDVRSEIFTVGLILHQMLSGRHPFDLGSRDDIAEAIRTKNPRPLPAKVPAPVAVVVERCLLKKPANRFQSMHSVLIALKKSGGSNHDTAEPVHNQPGKRAAQLQRSDGRSPEIRKVRAITARIEYRNIARSREALTELERLMGPGVADTARKTATTALRDFILTLPEYPDGVPNFVRVLRQQAFGVLRLSNQGPLSHCFRDQDFEHLDLYGMNFTSEQLSGLSQGLFPRGGEVPREQPGGSVLWRGLD
jgi:serine/threonine protein kinase